MKKFIATIMAICIMCAFTGAFAFTWGNEVADDCENYTVTVSKYSKVESDLGIAFAENASTTAKKGDKIFWNIEVLDADGKSVENYDVELFGIEYKGLNNHNLHTGIATQAAPKVKVTITEKTPLDELYFQNKKVVVDGGAVMIGSLVFLRNEKNVVEDVYYDGNVAEMIEKLAELGITVEDIYAGKICMSDDTLIANFGCICVSSGYAIWGAEVHNNVSMDIPKTGDTGIWGLIILCGIAAACCLKREK